MHAVSQQADTVSVAAVRQTGCAIIQGGYGDGRDVFLNAAQRWAGVCGRWPTARLWFSSRQGTAQRLTLTAQYDRQSDWTV